MVTWFLNFKLSKLLSLSILKIWSSSILRAKYWTFVSHLFAPKKIHRTTATSHFFRNFVTIQKNTTPHRIIVCQPSLQIIQGKFLLKQDLFRNRPKCPFRGKTEISKLVALKCFQKYTLSAVYLPLKSVINVFIFLLKDSIQEIPSVVMFTCRHHQAIAGDTC